VLRELLSLVGEGRLAPVIEREWPFEDAVAALRHVEEGHTVGKVVVRAA
jgi:NADPH:quinone reductase-like Zn-dependent oxidoreductase